MTIHKNDDSTALYSRGGSFGLVVRRVDPQNLVGVAEIVDRLGLSGPSAVHNWRERYDDFPKPVAILRMGVVFDWTAVRAWAEKTGHPRPR